MARRVRIDPLMYVVECGSNPDREAVSAALRGVAEVVRPRLGSYLVLAVVFAVYISMVDSVVLRRLPDIGGLTEIVVTLFFVIIAPLILVVGALVRVLKLRYAAKTLLEIARDVENGFLSPERVCGMSVAGVIELYRRVARKE